MAFGRSSASASAEAGEVGGSVEAGGRVKVSMPFSPTQLIPSTLNQLLLLRVVLIVHFLLVSLALTGTWHTLAYPFYNGFLIAGLLWVQGNSQDASPLPLLALLCLEGAAFVLDMVVMGVGTLVMRGQSSYWGWNGFSLFVAIVNLVCRIPAAIVLLKIRNDRMPPAPDEFAADPQPAPGHYAAPSPPPVYHPPTHP